MRNLRTSPVGLPIVEPGILGHRRGPLGATVAYTTAGLSLVMLIAWLA